MGNKSAKITHEENVDEYTSLLREREILNARSSGAALPHYPRENKNITSCGYVDSTLNSLFEEYTQRRMLIVGNPNPTRPVFEDCVRMYKVVELFDKHERPVKSAICVLEGTVQIGSNIYDSEGTGPINWDELIEDIYACSKDPHHLPKFTKVATSNFYPRRVIILFRRSCVKDKNKTELVMKNIQNNEWKMRPMMASFDKATDKIRKTVYKLHKPVVALDAGKWTTELGVGCVTGIHVSPSARWAFALGRERLGIEFDPSGNLIYDKSYWMNNFNIRSNLEQRKKVPALRREQIRIDIEKEVHIPGPRHRSVVFTHEQK